MMSHGDGEQLRILIVEDHADGAESLAILLRLDGYHVEIAQDGQSALEKGLTCRPHVVLLDLGLPGMSGYDVAREIARQETDRPFLIAVTGYGNEQSRSRSVEVGMDLHLIKPVDLELLHTILEQIRNGIR